jgi:hypothetical protein
MCFVRISEQTAIFALQNIKRMVFITEVESVYRAVRTESFIKEIRFVFKGLIHERHRLGNGRWVHYGPQFQTKESHLTPNLKGE